jgi:hypothetical protein
MITRSINFDDLSMVLSHVYNKREGLVFQAPEREHDLLVVNHDEIVGVPIWCTMKTPGTWTLEARDWIVGFCFYADYALDDPGERARVSSAAKFSQAWGETIHRWFGGDFEVFRRDMTAFKLALSRQVEAERVTLAFTHLPSGGPDEALRRPDAAVA